MYAARRLGAESVSFVLTRRPGRRTDLERSFPVERLHRVSVGALSLGATRQLLATRLGLRLPHHVLRRVYDVTTGNPLFVLEVGRTLVFRDLDALDEDIPLPDDVEDLLGWRVADLDDDVRRVLLALALGADVRVTQLRELAGPELLERAIEAGVVTVDGERVRPAPPPARRGGTTACVGRGAVRHAPPARRAGGRRGAPRPAPGAGHGDSRRGARRPDREGCRACRRAWSDAAGRRPRHALLAAHAAGRAGPRSAADRGQAAPRRRRAAAADRPAGSPGGVAPGRRVARAGLPPARLRWGRARQRRDHRAPREGPGGGGRHPAVPRPRAVVPGRERRRDPGARCRGLRRPGRRSGGRQRARRPRRPATRDLHAVVDPGVARPARRRPGRAVRGAVERARLPGALPPAGGRPTACVAR